ILGAVLQADYRADDTDMLDIAPLEAADQAVGVAPLHRERRNGRGIGPDNGARRLRRNAIAPDKGVEQGDIVAVARIVLGVDDLEVAPGHEAEAGTLEARLDDGGTADQDRARNLLLDQNLRRAQHPLLLAIGEGYALALPPRPVDDRLHHEAGPEHEAVEAVVIGSEVGDRPLGDAA